MTGLINVFIFLMSVVEMVRMINENEHTISNLENPNVNIWAKKFFAQRCMMLKAVEASREHLLADEQTCLTWCYLNRIKYYRQK